MNFGGNAGVWGQKLPNNPFSTNTSGQTPFAQMSNNGANNSGFKLGGGFSRINNNGGSNPFASKTQGSQPNPFAAKPAATDSTAKPNPFAAKSSSDSAAPPASSFTLKPTTADTTAKPNPFGSKPTATDTTAKPNPFGSKPTATDSTTKANPFASKAQSINSKPNPNPEESPTASTSPQADLTQNNSQDKKKESTTEKLDKNDTISTESNTNPPSAPTKMKKTVNTYGLKKDFVVKFYEMMFRHKPTLKWEEIDAELKALAPTLIE